MDKREVLITAAICTVAIAVCYLWFGSKRSESSEEPADSTPALSSKKPSNILGPSQWKRAFTEAYKPYKATNVFDSNTVPRGLTSRHNTKKDVFGLIHVIKGELKLTIFANKKEIESEQIVVIKQGECGLVAPQEWHKVTANSNDMQFYVEFWKVP